MCRASCELKKDLIRYSSEKIKLILNLGSFKIFPKSMEFETKFKDAAVPHIFPISLQKSWLKIRLCLEMYTFACWNVLLSENVFTDSVQRNIKAYKCLCLLIYVVFISSNSSKKISFWVVQKKRWQREQQIIGSTNSGESSDPVSVHSQAILWH